VNRSGRVRALGAKAWSSYPQALSTLGTNDNRVIPSRDEQPSRHGGPRAQPEQPQQLDTDRDSLAEAEMQDRSRGEPGDHDNEPPYAEPHRKHENSHRNRGESGDRAQGMDDRARVGQTRQQDTQRSRRTNLWGARYAMARLTP